MKVKNIVFSGFDAAILMGTAAANADPVFNIASRAYVDSKVSTGLVDNNENPISIADALAAKADTSDVSTLDSQINGNGGLADDVSDLQDALGSGFSSSNTVANAIDGKQNKLGGEGQNGKVVTATSTPGTRLRARQP